MRAPMTPRERWLAAIRCQPVDRLPFWPKLDQPYPLRQKEPFSRMSVSELHAWIGSDPHVGAPWCLRSIRKTTSVERTQKDGIARTTYRTPRGELVMVERHDPLTNSWHPREHPVKTADDIETMMLVYADEQVEFDPDGYEKAAQFVRDTGETALAVSGIGISPLMEWLQYVAGIENGLLLLADYPERVEALFAQAHRVMLRRAELLVEKGPYEVIYSLENTSTTIISPDLFRRYSLPHLQEYSRIIAGGGKQHVLHMCGKLKALLPDIDTLPAAALEAFTSPPVGNTTLADGRSAMPQKCFIGGTNATLWLEPANAIIRTIERDLAALPHRRGIVVTSGGVMPPACAPETIRRVGQWVMSQAA